jgi:hypothetical protein
MQPVTLPAPALPPTPRQYAKWAKEARRVAAEHRKQIETTLANHEEDPEHGHDGMAKTHERAAQAHEELAGLFDQGDKVDPRARRKVEQAAGRAAIITATCRKCPGEVTDPTVTKCSTCQEDLTVTDLGLEAERHQWLLRHGKRPPVVDLHIKGEPPVELGLETCRCAFCQSKNEHGRLKIAAAKRGRSN